MPVSKKKGTTSPPTASTPQSSSPSMPDQQAFHQEILEAFNIQASPEQLSGAQNSQH